MKKVVWIIVFVCSSIIVFAQGNKLPHQLLVGDNPPDLGVDQWIKGVPVDIREKGKVYLIDFWAAWCGPCIASMSHLSDLYKKYKPEGLEVIGATSADAWGNSFEQASGFLNEKGKEYNYNFAWLKESYRTDRKYRAIIYHPWFEMAYDSITWALPQVFLIDRDGKLAYIGDGYAFSEEYLEKVLQNHHDLKQERTKYIEQSRIEISLIAFNRSLEEKKYDKAIKMADSILANPNVSSHSTLYMTDMLFDKIKVVPNNTKMIDLVFAVAQKGAGITKNNSPSHLAALAKAYALKKNKDMAVKTLQKAVDLADGDFKEALEKDLKAYSQL